MKWYGNVTNRLMENAKMPEIVDGMDITKTYWSDRTCYWVEKVINQKRIIVGKYEVLADKDKGGGIGHQNWVYFKSSKDVNDYLEAHGDKRYYREDADVLRTWVFRYNKWQEEVVFTEDNYCTEKELKSLQKNGCYKRYYDVGKVVFGVRSYYYDWEF